MIEPQLTAKKIVYPLEVDESAPRVVADLERLQQIFINLIANSIRSTPPEGSIRVSARRRDREVEERVNDSGPGIPADKVGSLFSPFVQLGDGKSAETGLGLAISRELARAMGGDLAVDAEEGQGATFVLSLHSADRVQAHEEKLRSAPKR